MWRCRETRTQQPVRSLLVHSSYFLFDYIPIRPPNCCSAARRSILSSTIILFHRTIEVILLDLHFLSCPLKLVVLRNNTPIVVNQFTSSSALHPSNLKYLNQSEYLSSRLNLIKWIQPNPQDLTGGRLQAAH